MIPPRQLPDAPSEKPRIPGVRYRTEVRERLVPQTISGETRMVPDRYEVAVPVQPRDWDRLILRLVTGTAVTITGLSVAWTTAGIGALLAPIVPDPIAYGAAVVFDVAWMACQSVEWLERYDSQRARAARTAGWLVLLLALAAITAQGVTAGDTVAGAVGATVSLIAKGLWVILLRHYAVPLGPRVSNWLLQRRREVAAQRALAAELRRLDVEETHATAVFGPLAVAALRTTNAFGSTSPTTAETPADRPARSVDGSAMDRGKTVDPVIRRLPSPGRPSIAETIRTCLSEGISSDMEIIARVREVHGDRQNLVDTVTRTRRRIESRSGSR